MCKFEIRNQKFEEKIARWAWLYLLTGIFIFGASAGAQESPAPSSTPPTVTVSATVSPTPEGTPSASPSSSPEASATPTPSLFKKTGIKIQFLPPPMEGTISLGIYDRKGKLVRVLHREAKGDEFVPALDGYITHWDKFDDNGDPMPEGHYSAKGYMVGDIGIRAIPMPSPPAGMSNASATPSVSGTPQLVCGNLDIGEPIPGVYFPDGTPYTYQEQIHVGLVGNPLDRDRAGSADITVNLDSNGVAWLELADGLPLKKISSTQHVDEALVSQEAPGKPLIIYLVKVGAPTEAYEIKKISNMMAFDCGGFDLPAPDN